MPPFFFFQAEDGIRDYKVTGVQTCALPIWLRFEHRRAYSSPVFKTFAKPGRPWLRLSLLQGQELLFKPARRIAQRLRVFVHAQDEVANRLVPAAAMLLDELLHGLAERVVTGVMLLQERLERLARDQSRLFGRE